VYKQVQVQERLEEEVEVQGEVQDLRGGVE
jgi:hypothetical protein